MSTGVRMSVQLFGLPTDQYLPLTVRAEELGFEAVWLADHVVTPLEFARRYPYNESGDPGFRAETPLVDVAVTLGFLAARTSRILLATGVFVLPMRNPFHVARSWAALQNLSDGRAVLGLATGWMAEEFAAVGEDFATRGARADEMLEVLRLLWTGKPVEYHGRYFDFPSVHFAGAPATDVPFVFGGHAGSALRRAARLGSGWFGPNLDLDRTRALTERIDALRAEYGRSSEPFAHYVRLVGDVDVANVARYERAGYDHLVFAPFNRLPGDAPLADKLGALEDVATRLAPVWHTDG